MTDMPKPDETTLPEYSSNPFIAALPPIRDMKDLQRSFDRPPLCTEMDRNRPAAVRMHATLRLLDYSQPTKSSRDIGLRIDMMIRRGYVGRNPAETEWIRFASKVALIEIGEVEKEKARRGRSKKVVDGVLDDIEPIRDTSMSCLLVGSPGMGKTHSYTTALSYYQQVILHTEPMQIVQVVWLRIECPPNGSLVGLCNFFFAALDKALRAGGFESSLEKEYAKKPLAAQLTGMARLANLHAIGILVIDEIQHVGVNRTDGNALINFLVTLRNSIGISLMLVGTMSTQPILRRTFRDARRADGFGSFILERMGPVSALDDQRTSGEGARVSGDAPTLEPIYGKDFEIFVKKMWRWQYTNCVTELSVEILNALYFETQGITDLLVKLFILCQMRLMAISGDRSGVNEEITADLIHQVAKSEFNVVKPFIVALRTNDHEAMLNFEDLVDSSDWFHNQVQGMGLPEDTSFHDDDHGASRLPPMVTDGAIDPNLLDALLEALDIAVKDRQGIISRNAELIETGDLDGLAKAARAHLKATAAAPRKIIAPRKVKAPLVENDIRKGMQDVTSAAQVSDAVGGVELENALDE